MAKRFRTKISSERYIQGVIASYDHCKRMMLDGLSKMLTDQSTTTVDVETRLNWITEWVGQQTHPTTPKQNSEDCIDACLKEILITNV